MTDVVTGDFRPRILNRQNRPAGYSPCLDLDWRWHKYALDKGVWLSVNPDAHRKEGFLDMHYGILVARKGGLYKERCLNSLSLQEIDDFFKHNLS